MSLRARLVVFVVSLPVLALLPLGQTVRLTVACVLYLLVVLPGIDR